MKRFLIFAYDSYYPTGGWGDFDSDHDTLEEAREVAKVLKKRCEWIQIVDLETRELHDA